MLTSFHYVYCIENLLNGNVYVGKHSTEQIDDNYMGSGKRIIRAIKKYGVENFKKHILQICDSPEEAFELERQIVNEEFVANKNTYNIVLGGQGSYDACNVYYKNNPEKRQELGRNTLNKLWLDPEYRKRQAKSASEIMIKLLCEGTIKRCDWTGRKHREETKCKIGATNSIKQKGEGNSQFGTVWIMNHDEKRSLRIKNDDLQQYINTGWIKGRKMNWSSDETRQTCAP